MLKILYRDEIRNSKIVLLQGENGRNLIEKKLQKEGFKICLIECYKRVFKVLDGNIEAKKWCFYEIDTLLVTSSEALYQLKNIISGTNQSQWLFQCKIFVIGERLLQIAKKLGWKDIIVSSYANNEYLLKIIKKVYFTI